MARKERFVNDASTTLSAGITDVATSATVVDGSVFPAEGDFRIRINSEIIKVTARSTNTLTLERAQEGTAGAAHSSTDAVVAILTANALEEYAKENTWHGNTSPALRIYNLSTGAPAPVSAFTWVNQGSATATDRDGRIILRTPPGAGANVRGLFQTAPTPPYEIILGCHAIGERVNFGQYGLAFRESSTGKLMSIVNQFNGVVEIPKHTNATTFSALLGSSINWEMGQSINWFKIEDDNTDLNFYVSPNGQDWIELGTEGRTTHMAGGPDQVGFITNPAQSNTYQILMEVLHFGEV